MMKGLIAGQFSEGRSVGEDKTPLQAEESGDQVSGPSGSAKPGEPENQPEKQKVSERSNRSLDDILLEHISRKVKDR